MAKRKVKLLSEHDVKEVAMFMEHCRDLQTMDREAFYRKWQHYMGLSDSELENILRKAGAVRDEQ